MMEPLRLEDTYAAIYMKVRPALHVSLNNSDSLHISLQIF